MPSSLQCQTLNQTARKETLLLPFWKGVHTKFTYLRLFMHILSKFDRLVQLVRIHKYHKPGGFYHSQSQLKSLGIDPDRPLLFKALHLIFPAAPC